MTQPFLQIVLVAIGSALGGVSRWMVHLAVGRSCFDLHTSPTMLADSTETDDQLVRSYNGCP
jgi:fluoride ion exporter CrcB/FEX